MAASLNRILKNALIPAQADDQKVNKYKWSISKTDRMVHYVNASTKGSSIEKAYTTIDQNLKAYMNVPSVSKEQRMQLEELRIRAKIFKDGENTKHSSFLGRIYLIIRGSFNGGHINKVSRNLDDTIDQLLKKPLTPNVEDLDTFLNLVAPTVDELNISFLKVSVHKWVLDSHTHVIQDKECNSDEGPQDPDEILRILEVMNGQLSAFDTLKKVTASQKEQLEKLKSLVKARAPDEVEIKTLILDKVERLQALEVSSVENEETIQKMLTLKEAIYQELLGTERTFLGLAKQSVEKLTLLNSIKEEINYSSRYRPFFEGNVDEETKKASLENCIEAFRTLETHAVYFLEAMEDIMRYDFEKRDQELASIFKSELFTTYAKQMSVCARYYEVLCALEQDLKVKNRNNSHIKPYFYDEKSKKEKDPTNYFIKTVQRLPQLQILMFDLTKNTPGQFSEYRRVYSAYIQALSFASNINKRLNYSFSL